MKKILLISIMIMLAIYSCDNSKKSKTQEKPKFKSDLDTFNYTAPKPDHGKVKMGTIVIGSSGFDAFVINCDSMDRWELISSIYDESRIISDSISAELIRKGIYNFEQFFNSENIDRDKIHIVISSSAIKNEKAKELLLDMMYDFPYTVKIVTENEEALFAFKSVIPKEFINEAFIIDMGSGNTKISWMESKDIKTRVTYGSEFVRDSTAKETVASSFISAVKQVPDELTTHCFIIGGAPFEIAEASQNREGRYSVINNLDEYKLTSTKARSGKFILSQLRDNLEIQNLIFDHESNFGIGYLLTIN